MTDRGEIKVGEKFGYYLVTHIGKKGQEPLPRNFQAALGALGTITGKDLFREETTNRPNDGEEAFVRFGLAASYSIEELSRDKIRDCLVRKLRTIKDTEVSGMNFLTSRCYGKEFTITAEPEQVMMYGYFSSEFHRFAWDVGERIGSTWRKMQKTGRFGTVLVYMR